jgi:hypothetical protein
MPSTQNSNAPSLTLVPSRSREAKPADSTLAQLEAVKAQLMQIEASLRAERDRAARAARVGAPEILTCLKQHGHLTAAQLLAKPELGGLAKSSLWLHLNALEREGKVWFRVTHGGQGGRKITEIYHSDAIVT